MEMSIVFDKLKSLQEILSEKYKIEAKINEAPKTLSNQEEAVTQRKKEFIEKSKIYDEKQKLVAELKTKLAEAEAAREHAEKGMDSITTHREYEALEKEIEDAKKLEQLVRKDLQREEKNLAELDETLKFDEKTIEDTVNELNEKKVDLDKDIGSYKEELDKLNQQEVELEEGIDPDIIFKFKRIIRSKQGKGIVAVKGKVCDGCHMILPAQFANEVHNGENIVFCPYCSRILFYQELNENETEYSQIEDIGSLVGFGDDDYDDYDDYDEDDEGREDTIKPIYEE